MIHRARYAGRLRGVSEGTAGAATAAVVMAGVIGRLEPGTIAAAMTIVGLLVAPLRDLGRVQEYWHNAQVSREKLRSFLARPTGLDEPVDPAAMQRGEGRLRFEDVHLHGVLHGISATAEPGQIVAIVGPNGAGKTTLLTLAARLMEPDGGRILLDGQHLALHAAADVRRYLGLVGPDLPLLRGTVERNLRYRWPDGPDEELERVTERCDFSWVVDSLPDGMATRAWLKGGVSLSAGQRQRPALALVGDAPVLLLDEADANLDGDAASVVDRVIAEHTGTVLVVTHQRERMAGADAVWHICDGQLVEQGHPDDLLIGDGPTARLFARQLRVVSRAGISRAGAS